MAGRFTGMRHVRLKQDILTKTTKLVRGGLMPEEPWLQKLRALPPQYPGPNKGKPPKIVLPTDKLFRAREAKQSARDLNEPFYAHGEVQSSSMLFAQRQWAAMQEDKTLTEAEAYKKVERDMEVARATALEQVKALTEAAQAEGARVPALLRGSAAPLVSGGDRLAQLEKWREKLSDEPWATWELGQQVMLDHWICRAALGWGWEEERYLRGADFEAEMAALREALFPETAPDYGFGMKKKGDEAQKSAAAAAAYAEELEAAVEAADWENDALKEQVNDWFVAFGKWQTKAFEASDWSKWDDASKDALDAWLLMDYLVLDRRPGSHSVNADVAAEALATARWKLFPRLQPQEAGATEKAPDYFPEISHVQRIVVAKNKQAENLGKSPSQKGEATAEGKRRFMGGVEAIKALEQADNGGTAATKPKPGVFASLAALSSNDNDEGDNDDEPEDLTDEDRELTAEIRRIEALEAAAVKQGKRDEQWERRERAREVLIAARRSEARDVARQASLSFALPDIKDETTQNSTNPSMESRPAKKGATKRIS